MDKVILRQEKVIIPTYEISDYDKNPMFLEKRVYQGSSGRVYPHPVCYGVSDKKINQEYHAIFLENNYILVMILPEIGGRIQRLYDKTNNYDAIYYNEVIKPALVGLAGPWISGGIEFNWPQHHRPSTFDAINYTIEEHIDGSITVWTGEIEKMFHTKGMTGFTVYPDRAYLEVKGQVYNPTDRPQTFLWWANPAVAVNEHTQSIFPPDVHAVLDHGKRDVSKFPIADSIYYKVDYSPGTDISRYKNIPVPTSYMAYHSDFDFIGNYDYKKQAGLLHLADHHISPGKKQWTWGCGDFGKAWDRNLTDENGPYIELMTGMFTDNQPDFTFLKPYEEKRFTQYFMPYKNVGAVKNASIDAVLNLEVIPSGAPQYGHSVLSQNTDRKIKITIYAPKYLDLAEIELLYQNKIIFQETITLKTSESYIILIPYDDIISRMIRDSSEKNISSYASRDILEDASSDISKDISSYTSEDILQDITLNLKKASKTLLNYKHIKNTDSVPSPAQEILEPEKLDTTEKLFLAAVHLEQYRHATYSPEPYYLEGLKRDPSDIRLNNGYGKYLYNKGCFLESAMYFQQAAKSSIWKNPNPYDCEPYYNLGLALKTLGNIEKAFDAFYKAIWDGNMQDKAFYQLSCITASRGEYKIALKFIEDSLIRGLHNFKARTLKTVLLRLSGKLSEAIKFAKETKKIDPLDYGSHYELYKLTSSGIVEFRAILEEDNHNYLELANSYIEAGLYSEASNLLKLAPKDDEPMIHYYQYFCTGEKAELEKAENSSSLYCFPNRLEDIAILKNAVTNGGHYAAYYLGNLLYDKECWIESVNLWESCADKINLPTVYRNLALAYYNKLHKKEKARIFMEKAFAKDTSDARIFFELDQLYKTLNFSCKERLEHMKLHTELLEKRDDLYTEYITLLNINGEFELAYHCIKKHHFHPWEGGEGKITTQYRNSLINLAKKQADREKALELLEEALVYPYNLGEGKLIGNLDNDIYYLMGTLYEDSQKQRKAFQLAAKGDFILSSAMYYNDQPPERMYYATLALEALGQHEEAMNRFDAFIDYGKKHIKDHIKIDYFAVSLPDFLIFEADLDKKNKVHCLFMMSLGYMGKGEKEMAFNYVQKALELDKSHLGLISLCAKLKI